MQNARVTSEHRQLALAAGLIALACLAAFAPAFRAGVTNWDDPTVLAATAHPEWAFSSFVMGNYHPLTTLSLSVGRTPVVLHGVNVALHIVTSILVLIFVWQLGGSVAGSAAGALLWAVHPLRAESVVWISQRKDVLSAVFFVAALIAYVAHVRGRRGALAWSFVLFLIALLSKVTVVSLPIVLLLIDWLLGRRAWREKIPFFAASAVFTAIAIAGQHSAVLDRLPTEAFTIPERLVLACRAIVLALERIVIPANLSAFYPYPAGLGAREWSAVAIVIALVGIAVATLRWTRAAVFALAFFLVTIAVALPLFATGWTLAADRFTYLPSIAVAWLIALAVRRIPSLIWPAALLAIAFIVLTNVRSRIWHDSVSLWTSVIDYTEESRLPFNNRGAALAEMGRFAEARRDFDRALAIDPCYGGALRNRALLSLREGNVAAAKGDLARLARCGSR